MARSNDPAKIAKTAIRLITLWIVASSLDAASSAFTVYVLNRIGSDASAQVVALARLTDRVNLVTSSAALVAMLVAGVAVLRWIALTNRQAHNWSDQMTVSPRWAVGWFFVPVANLYMPFRGVSETWRATVAPEQIDRVPVPGRLRLWWVCGWRPTCGAMAPSAHGATPRRWIN